MRLLDALRGVKFKTAAEDIAQSLSRDIPPSIALGELNLSANRLTTILERRFQRAVEFQAENPMNWLRRAQFANAFHWKMLEMGYAKELVEVATEGLVHELTKARQNRGNPSPKA